MCVLFGVTEAPTAIEVLVTVAVGTVLVEVGLGLPAVGDQTRDGAGVGVSVAVSCPAGGPIVGVTVGAGLPPPAWSG